MYFCARHAYMHVPCQHCAQTLLDFNGGASCVQVYVNQHDFFINRVRETKTSNDSALYVLIFARLQLILIIDTDPCSWDALPNPDNPPPKIEKGLMDLFVEIRSTVGQEAQIVQAVFPNPPFVMQVFLQRVFAQSVSALLYIITRRLTPLIQIQEYMEQLLNRGAAISDLAYLRVLQLIHTQTSLLVEDLKGYELPSITPRSPLDVAEFRRTLSGNPSSTGPATTTAIGTMLETAMEELFVQQTEGQRYLERESASLGQLYSNLLTNFTRYHVRTGA